jgi:cobalamin biosynthesis protein CbiD
MESVQHAAGLANAHQFIIEISNFCGFMLDKIKK